MFTITEGTSNDSHMIFHDAFLFISHQRELEKEVIDEDVSVYLSGRDDREQYGITVFKKKMDAFSRIVEKVRKTRKRAREY